MAKFRQQNLIMLCRQLLLNPAFQLKIPEHKKDDDIGRTYCAQVVFTIGLLKKHAMLVAKDYEHAVNDDPELTALLADPGFLSGTKRVKLTLLEGWFSLLAYISDVREGLGVLRGHRKAHGVSNKTTDAAEKILSQLLLTCAELDLSLDPGNKVLPQEVAKLQYLAAMQRFGKVAAKECLAEIHRGYEPGFFMGHPLADVDCRPLYLVYATHRAPTPELPPSPPPPPTHLLFGEFVAAEPPELMLSKDGVAHAEFKP
ncbi:MAG: hypothetical protein P1U63_03205 [Coxiellaceae bacterium]|nr:hypothetical protein [Coxiellaceae bacterium]